MNNNKTMAKKRQKRPLPRIDQLLSPRVFHPPKQFFNQLNEFSSGGWILVMGSEHGDPQIYQKFDNSLGALALNDFCKRYFNLVDIATNQNLINNSQPDESESED